MQAVIRCTASMGGWFGDSARPQFWKNKKIVHFFLDILREARYNEDNDGRVCAFHDNPPFKENPMTSRKTRLLFVALIALAFGALPGSGYAIKWVPITECPISFVAPSVPGCHVVHTGERQCWRSERLFVD